MRRLLMVVGTATIVAQLILEPGFAKDQNNASATTVLLPGAITGIGSHGPIGYWRCVSRFLLGLTSGASILSNNCLSPAIHKGNF